MTPHQPHPEGIDTMTTPTVAEAREAFERAVLHGEGDSAHLYAQLVLAEARARPGATPTPSYAEAVDALVRRSATELADELRREREQAEAQAQAEVLEGPIVGWFVGVSPVLDVRAAYERGEVWRPARARHDDLEAVGRVAWCHTSRTSIEVWNPLDPMFNDGRPRRVKPHYDSVAKVDEDLARRVMEAEEEKGAVLDHGEVLRMVWPDYYEGRDLNPPPMPVARTSRRGAPVVTR